MATRKRSFGNVRKLPSKRWQARYTGPDGKTHSAKDSAGKPLTFETRRDAEAWLSLRQSEIVRKKWVPEAEVGNAPAALTLRVYADAWLIDRDLAVRTRELYAALLTNHIYPTFGDTALAEITSPEVRKWHAALVKRTGPTARAHAYGLLHAVCKTAVDDDLILANPCKIRGAGQVKRQTPEPEPATVAELAALVAAMPARYRLLILLAGWCAPRFGELTELRRSDVDLQKAVLRIRRAVVVTTAGRVVKPPKSEAGIRTVAIPPHLIEAVKAHLRDHVGEDDNALLFPSASGDHLSESTLRKHWYKARRAAGRPDLKLHDLRHTAGTLAAQTGASLKELMARLGHSTVHAAMRYQHAAHHRDQLIAAGLSELATAANVTQIAAAPSAKKSRRRPA
jgi:integrase